MKFRINTFKSSDIEQTTLEEYAYILSKAGYITEWEPRKDAKSYESQYNLFVKIGSLRSLADIIDILGHDIVIDSPTTNYLDDPNYVITVHDDYWD